MSLLLSLSDLVCTDTLLTLFSVSSKGIRNSFGIMINYLYKMDDIEDNRVQYELSGRVVSNEGVSRWL